MEKRFFIALALSFLVISVYSGLRSQQQAANKEVAMQSEEAADAKTGTEAVSSSEKPGTEAVFPTDTAVDTTVSTADSSVGSAAVPGDFEAQVFDDEMPETAKYETSELVITISKRGGYIKTVDLKEPRARLSFRGLGAVRGWADVLFEMRQTASGFVLEYRASPGAEIVKEFSFETPLSMTLDIRFSGITDLKSDNYKILLGSVSTVNKKDPIGMRYLELAYYEDAVARRSLLATKKPLVESGDMGWVGLRDKYFCQVVVPGEPGLEGFEIRPFGEYRFVWAPVDSLQSVKARIYLGPQNEKALRSFEEGTHQIVSYGKFDIIAKPVSLLLVVLQRVTKNWGIAIILMTIIVYTLLSPLSLKSMKSMRRMQALQPQVEALKKKFKDNPQKLNA